MMRIDFLSSFLSFGSLKVCKKSLNFGVKNLWEPWLKGSGAGAGSGSAVWFITQILKSGSVVSQFLLGEES